MDPAEYRTLNQAAIDQPQTIPHWCKCDVWIGNRRIIVLNGSRTGLMIHQNQIQETGPLPNFGEFPVLTPSEEPICRIYGQVTESLNFYHPIKTAIGVVYLAKSLLNNTSEYFAKLDKFESTTPKITDLRHMSYPLLQTALLVMIKAERFFSLGDPCSILEVCDFFCSPLLEEKLFLLFKYAFKNYELNTESDVNTLVDILKDDRVRARPKIQELLFSHIKKFIEMGISEHLNDFGVLENLIKNWPQELPLLRVSLGMENVALVSKISQGIGILGVDISESDEENKFLLQKVSAMNHLKSLTLNGGVSVWIEYAPNSLDTFCINNGLSKNNPTPEFLTKLTRFQSLKNLVVINLPLSQQFIAQCPKRLEEITSHDYLGDIENPNVDLSGLNNLKEILISKTISIHMIQNLPPSIQTITILWSKYLTQECVNALSHLPSLTNLTLDDGLVPLSTADGFDFSSLSQIQTLKLAVSYFSSSLLKHLPPKCTSITLTYTSPDKSDSKKRKMDEDVPEDQRLHLLPKGSISDEDVILATNLLKEMPYLKTLSFSQWELTDKFISLLPKNLEGLELISSWIPTEWNPTDQCAEDLNQMKELRNLNIDKTRLTDQAIEKLPDSIEELSIKKCQHITTAIAPKLSAMPNLKKVVCSGKFLETLKDLLPLHIELTN